MVGLSRMTVLHAAHAFLYPICTAPLRAKLALDDRSLGLELPGMPQGEIAAQMGLTRNALYKLTHDARKNLKRGLEAAGIGEDEVRETFGL